MANPVTLIPSRKTLFVGAYTRLRVEIDPGSAGLTWDDLVFEVSGRTPGRSRVGRAWTRILR